VAGLHQRFAGLHREEQARQLLRQVRRVPDGQRRRSDHGRVEQRPVLAEVNRIAGAVALVAVLGGCSTARPPTAPAPAPAVRVDAALTSPTDVALHWTGPESGAAGWVVEYATDPHGPFTVLQFVPPGQTPYRHPNLMPETVFFYRVLPFLGP